MHGRLLRLSIVGSVAAALDMLVLCGCLCFWSIRPAASVIVLQRDQTAWTVPGVLVLRVDSPIYFANSGYLRERITRWTTTNGPAPRARPACSTTSSTWVRSAASTLAGRACLTGSRRPWTGEQFSIDTSRTSMLDELKKTLDRRTIQIVLANPRSEIMKKLDSSKIWSGNAQSMYHKMMVLL